MIPVVDSVTQGRSRIDLVDLLLLSEIIHLLRRGFLVQEAKGENRISDLWYIISVTLDNTEHISVKVLLGGTQRVFLILTLIARTGGALKFTESALEIVFRVGWKDITIAIIINGLLLLLVRQVLGNVWLLRESNTFSRLISIIGPGIFTSFEVRVIISAIIIQDIFLQNVFDLLNIVLELLALFNRFDVQFLRLSLFHLSWWLDNSIDIGSFFTGYLLISILAVLINITLAPDGRVLVIFVDRDISLELIT